MADEGQEQRQSNAWYTILALRILLVAAAVLLVLVRAKKQGKFLGRPDGFERWAPILADMKEQQFSQGRMSRETGLSYNTVKKYLKRLEAPAVPADRSVDATGMA